MQAVGFVLLVLVLAMARYAAGDAAGPVLPIREPDSLDRVVGIIRDVGFPIVVAVYLLLRMDPTLRDLTKALAELASRLDDFNRRMGA